MNTTMFMKLAYAIARISRIDFTLLERTGYEQVTDYRTPYAKAADLQNWATPDVVLVCPSAEHAGRP
jgi:hypothetical protein